MKYKKKKGENVFQTYEHQTMSLHITRGKQKTKKKKKKKKKKRQRWFFLKKKKEISFFF